MKSGYVALVGRPNVGKSTLLNHLLGQKLSIVSRRPQTTRHRILGIKTDGRGQVIYVDTPGIHGGARRAINRYLNRTAISSLLGVDVILWLVDRAGWLPDDELVMARIKEAKLPVILVINKVDRIEGKDTLLPFLAEANATGLFSEIVPISALKGINLAVLEERVLALLPEGEPIYPEDQISDRPERFFVAEIIREKLFNRLTQEVPHALTVQIEQYRESPTLVRIHAVIWVEREGQKAIVIGKGGEVLKRVGEASRRELERMLERRVYLELWTKVKHGWSDNERALQGLGYAE
ncbi:GTPase Era [Methylococcus capsulatus]|uniref:GTPase Era n=1 Tax=Methylococcus capsulatus TaxID=414 RepID=UPI002FD946DE